MGQGSSRKSTRCSECEEPLPFGILLIGEIGSGKTTLLNNLLRKKRTKDDDFVAPPSDFSPVVRTVEGVPVELYDKPGFCGDTDGVYLESIRELLHGKHKIDLVILCVKMSETRLRHSLIRSFQEHDKVGVDWERVIIALTFADCFPVPSKQRKTFQIPQYFNRKVSEWRDVLQNALFEQVGVKQEVAKRIPVYPTSRLHDEALPNREQWLVPLWTAILKKRLLDAARSEWVEGKYSVMNNHDRVQQQTVSSTLETRQEELHSRTWSQELQKSSVSTSAMLETQDLQVVVDGASTESEHHAILWRSVKHNFSEVQKSCPIFGVLVIGETGSGKSTLINNLLGRDVAKVGHTMQSLTSKVTPYDVAVEGVGLSVYDTPGLDDSRGVDYEKGDLKIMQDLLVKRKIHLVIYCFRMTETKMRAGLVHALQEYDRIGLPWQHTIMALTFADCVPNFDTRLPEVQEMLRDELLRRFWPRRDAINKMKSCPTTGCIDKLLPNGTPWFTTFSSMVEESLSSYA